LASTIALLAASQAVRKEHKDLALGFAAGSLATSTVSLVFFLKADRKEKNKHAH
jgi:hypothetical protein